MKYKVGDKVKIREDLHHNKEYNDCSVEKEMEEYRGAIATITRCCYDDDYYEINIDGGNWVWTDDMFEDYIEDIEKEKTFDIGFHLDYCGHKVLKNVVLNTMTSYGHIFFNIKDDKNQYILLKSAIDFIVPHED